MPYTIQLLSLIPSNTHWSASFLYLPEGVTHLSSSFEQCLWTFLNLRKERSSSEWLFHLYARRVHSFFFLALLLKSVHITIYKNRGLQDIPVTIQRQEPLSISHRTITAMSTYNKFHPTCHWILGPTQPWLIAYPINLQSGSARWRESDTLHMGKQDQKAEDVIVSSGCECPRHGL